MGFPLKKIVVKTRKMIRVPCPYCKVGHGIFQCVVTDFGGVEGDAGEPIRCDSCQKYFRIKPRIVFDGVPLEEMKKEGMVIS